MLRPKLDSLSKFIFIILFISVEKKKKKKETGVIAQGAF